MLGHELAEHRQSIFVHVFVKSPYHRLVRDSSRFWNASGIEVALGAGGVKVKTRSLQSLLQGGIEFDTPTSLRIGVPSEEGAVFVLYDTEKEVEESKYIRRFLWVMYFDESVRGLRPDAPVEFRGIKIGSVKDVKLELDAQTLVSRTPVLVEIEPQRIAVIGEGSNSKIHGAEQHGRDVERLIAQGLRARLKTASLVTGQLLVEVDMFPDTPVRLVGADDRYPEIPTLPSSLNEITATVTELLERLDGLPLEDIASGVANAVQGVENLVNAPELLQAVRTLDETLKELRALVRTMDADVMPELKRTLVTTNRTLAAAERTLGTAERTLGTADRTMSTAGEAISQDSPLRYNLETTLGELAAAARYIRLLAEYLERHPNALIYGKTERVRRR